MLSSTRAAPQNISYPQDVNLLSEVRENLEGMIAEFCYTNTVTTDPEPTVKRKKGLPESCEVLRQLSTNSFILQPKTNCAVIENILRRLIMESEQASVQYVIQGEALWISFLTETCKSYAAKRETHRRSLRPFCA